MPSTTDYGLACLAEPWRGGEASSCLENSPEALPKPLRVGGLLLGWAAGCGVSLLVPLNDTASLRHFCMVLRCPRPSFFSVSLIPSSVQFPGKGAKPSSIVLYQNLYLYSEDRSIWSMGFCIMLFCELVLVALCPELAHVPESLQNSLVRISGVS